MRPPRTSLTTKKMTKIFSAQTVTTRKRKRKKTMTMMTMTKMTAVVTRLGTLLSVANKACVIAKKVGVQWKMIVSVRWAWRNWSSRTQVTSEDQRASHVDRKKVRLCVYVSVSVFVCLCVCARVGGLDVLSRGIGLNGQLCCTINYNRNPT